MLDSKSINNMLYDISRLIDIHSAQTNSSQQINNQDNILVSVTKAWHPVGHHYLILQIKLKPTNNKGWNQIATIDSDEIEGLDQIDAGEIISETNDDIQKELLNQNINHQQNFDYNFISSKLPSLDEIIDKRKSLGHQLQLVFSTQLIPFIQDDIFEPQYDRIAANSKQFYINFANVNVNFASFTAEKSGIGSNVEIDVELINSHQESMDIKQHLSIPISYYDYSSIYWIYAKDDRFKEVQNELTNIQPLINTILKHITEEKKHYHYREFNYLIGKFYNFAIKDKFLLNDNHKGDIKNTFLQLYKLNVYSGLVKSVQSSNISDQILEVIISSKKTRSGEAKLLMGPGGMSLDDDTIYNPRSTDYASLQKAKYILAQHIIYPSLVPKVQMLAAIYDGRQNLDSLIKKAQTDNVKHMKQEKSNKAGA